MVPNSCLERNKNNTSPKNMIFKMSDIISQDVGLAKKGLEIWIKRFILSLIDKKIIKQDKSSCKTLDLKAKKSPFFHVW